MKINGSVRRLAPVSKNTPHSVGFLPAHRTFSLPMRARFGDRRSHAFDLERQLAFRGTDQPP